MNPRTREESHAQHEHRRTVEEEDFLKSEYFACFNYQ